MKNCTDNSVGENHLTKVSDIHNHNTRHASKSNFFIPRKRTGSGKQSFSYNGPVVWQSIPPQFKELTFGLFKYKLKNLFLENYNNQ